MFVGTGWKVGGSEWRRWPGLWNEGRCLLLCYTCEFWCVVINGVEVCNAYVLGRCLCKYFSPFFLSPTQTTLTLHDTYPSHPLSHLFSFSSLPLPPTLHVPASLSLLPPPSSTPSPHFPLSFLLSPPRFSSTNSDPLTHNHHRRRSRSPSAARCRFFQISSPPPPSWLPTEVAPLITSISFFLIT